MAGVGMFTLLAMIAILPFEIWQGAAEKRQRLSPHELYLRRATQPLGIAAVFLFGLCLFNAAGKVGNIVVPLLHDATGNWVPLAVIAAVLLYGVTSVIVGTARCWGMRSDSMLPVWAFLKLAVGSAGLVWLNQNGARALGDAEWAGTLWLGLSEAAVWCITVGGGRFLLLSVGGGNARRRVRRHIAQTQVVMRPVRRRPWWLFWKFW